MFNKIIDRIKKDNRFLHKGIYLEDRQNYWISIIPKNPFNVEIQYKNGGYKKQRRTVDVQDRKKIDGIFKEWTDENKDLKNNNLVLEEFLKDETAFFTRIIEPQKIFRKNIRTFEIQTEEKMKQSNEDLQKSEDLKYIPFYFIIKQFRLKMEISPVYSVINPYNQEIILLKNNKTNKMRAIKTPLEFKLVIEESLTSDEKKNLKQGFAKEAKKKLNEYIDTSLNGINRLIDKFSI